MTISIRTIHKSDMETHPRTLPTKIHRNSALSRSSKVTAWNHQRTTTKTPFFWMSHQRLISPSIQHGCPEALKRTSNIAQTGQHRTTPPRILRIPGKTKNCSTFQQQVDSPCPKTSFASNRLHMINTRNFIKVVGKIPPQPTKSKPDNRIQDHTPQDHQEDSGLTPCASGCLLDQTAATKADRSFNRLLTMKCPRDEHRANYPKSPIQIQWEHSNKKQALKNQMNTSTKCSRPASKSSIQVHSQVPYIQFN